MQRRGNNRGVYGKKMKKAGLERHGGVVASGIGRAYTLEAKKKVWKEKERNDRSA